MYTLEYKQLYIPRESQTKNRTFQGYRWKQYAVCEERGTLEQIKAVQKRPEDWRIVPLAAKMNDFGELLCGACGVTLVCNDCGDMPLACPECGAELRYINKKES